MKRLVIAGDCDDVLVRTTPFFVNAYNEKYGTNVLLADARDGTAPSWGGLDDAVIIKRWEQLMETDGYKGLRPDPLEVLLLHELANHHELHLVTARKEHEREFTRTMLDTALEGVFTSMEFVGWEGSKGEVCKRLGADVLIDDNASHLHDALAYGLPVGGAILFGDYSWNSTSHMHDELVHCLDWPGVKKVIDEIAAGDGSGGSRETGK